MSRVCPRCGEHKPATTEHFHRNNRRRDGLACYCKNCVAAIDLARQPRKTSRRVGVRTAKQVLSKRYREKHRATIKARNSHPLRRLRANLSNRLYSAFRAKKPETTMRLVGCTLEELRLRMELLFEPGMSWENYGEWEVDHIRPLSSFDLNDPAQVERACRHTNLQPLWRGDNRRKRARWL